MANRQSHQSITGDCYLFLIVTLPVLQHRESDIFPLVIVVSTHGSGSLNSSDPEWSTEPG